MTSPAARAFAVLAVLILISLPTRAQSPEPPTLRVGRLTGALVLDGRMRDQVWATVDSAVLSEVEPMAGGIPRERTVVKVLASADLLIIGVRCDDPGGADITSFSRARDADLSAEDHVRIVIDPFLNGQSGYVFAVNPSGARYDALISEQAQRLGDRENANWDTIWEAATSRTPRGWSLEIRIPVRSLLYKPGLTRWGFNVQRRVQRLQQTQRWAYPQRNYRITQMTRAGILMDIPAFNLDRGIAVRPAIVLGAGIAAPTAPPPTPGAVSPDAPPRFGSNTVASVTVNTDFA